LSYINVEELKKQVREEIMPIVKQEVRDEVMNEVWWDCMRHIQTQLFDPSDHRFLGLVDRDVAPATPKDDEEGEEGEEAAPAGSSPPVPTRRPQVPLRRHPFCGRHWWGEKPRTRGSPYPTSRGNAKGKSKGKGKGKAQRRRR